jgi:hypothetical protein
MMVFKRMSTHAAIAAAEWHKAQNIPLEKWVLAPDLSHERFEIKRCQGGIYELRWTEDKQRALAGGLQ